MAADDNVPLPAPLPVGRPLKLFRRFVFIQTYNSMHCQRSLIPNYPHLWRLSVARKSLLKIAKVFTTALQTCQNRICFVYPGGLVITYSSPARIDVTEIRICEARAVSLFCCDNRRLYSIR